MILGTDEVVLEYDDKLLTYEDVLSDDHYYYGILDVETRPQITILTGLTKVNKTPGSSLTVPYESDLGYLVLLVPYGVKQYESWQVRTNNKGPIRGSIDDLLVSLFVEPDVTIIENIVYKVYVSSFKTKVYRPVIFRHDGIPTQ